jgi:molecular chaperone GrpE (heat shock protein)
MTQSPRELAAHTVKIQRDQERLYQDLLGILDALDHACDHWQQAKQEHRETVVKSASRTTVTLSQSLFQRWKQRLQAWLNRLSTVSPDSSDPTETLDGADPMTEVLESAREGVEMIRRSLLDILRQRQVMPLEVIGQPFDPSRMYALGRQEHENVEENTVVQEVVRGYLWQNRTLRESQVMVAVKPSGSEPQSESPAN